MKVIGRENERQEIRSFLDRASDLKVGSSLYIAGCPGTGKTLCVQSTIQEWSTDSKENPSVTVYVNAMGLKSPIHIFAKIADQITKSPLSRIVGRRKRKKCDVSGEYSIDITDGVSRVVNAVSTRKKTLVIIDELDRLCPTLAASKCRDFRRVNHHEIELIASLLKLSTKATSWLCVIGIANSVDLAVNLDLYYGSRCFSESITFAPYTSGELRSILASVTGDRMDNAALELCVRKVASVHGDCRKAIDVCRQAVTAARSDTAVVGIMDTAKLIDQCYRSAFDSDASLRALPFQQLLVLAAACNVALAEPKIEQFAFSVLKQSFQETTRLLNLPSRQATAGVSSLVEQATALGQCGLLQLKDPSKGRLGTWRLQVPAGSLRATLNQTNALIATAVAEN